MNVNEFEGSLVQEQIQEILTKQQESGGCAKNMFHADPILNKGQTVRTCCLLVVTR